MLASMIFKTVLILGILSLSMGVPLTYDPKDFYATSQRIHGGEDAPDGFAPHMMALLVGDVFTALMCGAAMAGRWRVITAAHCVEPMLGPNGQLLPSVRGAVGSNIWSDERITYKFSGYRNHPDYDRWSIKSDIGVLFLSEEAELTERVGVIAPNFDWVGGGKRIYLTGWGTTVLWGVNPNQLQLLHVATLSPEKCEEGVREAQAVMGFSPPVDPELEVCTKHEDGAGHGTCHGDSGSPLVDESGRQIGIVSWGFPCALGYPDVHVRISGFRDFLEPLLDDQTSWSTLRLS